MKYPIAVWNTDGVYSAEVPDLPGAITNAETIADLQSAVKEAAAGWMECEIDAGHDIALPSPIEKHMDKPEYKDCLWLFTDLDIEAITDKIEHVDISLPVQVLRRLDSLAKAAGDSRSGFIAHLVLSQCV